MTCDQWQIKMIDAAAGEISREDRAALEAHLATCTSCAKEFAAMEAAGAHVARAAGTRAEAVAATSGLELYSPRRVAWPARLAIAAAVGLAFAGGYALRVAGEEREPAPREVAASPVRASTPAAEYARLHASAPRLPAMARGMLSLARR